MDGQGEREPDGRGVEHRGYDLVHGVPRVTGLDRGQRLVVVAQRVHVEQPRGREQQREHVGQGHGHEHHVGGRAHVPLGQHDDDERVGHDGDQQQERHDEPVHGPRVLDWHLVRHVQVAALGSVHDDAVHEDRGPVVAVHAHRVIRRGHHHHGRGIVLRVHRRLTTVSRTRAATPPRDYHSAPLVMVDAVTVRGSVGMAVDGGCGRATSDDRCYAAVTLVALRDGRRARIDDSDDGVGGVWPTAAVRVFTRSNRLARSGKKTKAKKPLPTDCNNNNNYYRAYAYNDE